MNIGDMVIVKDNIKDDSDSFIGKKATLKDIDKSDTVYPYEVQFADGMRLWVCEVEIVDKEYYFQNLLEEY